MSSSKHRRRRPSAASELDPVTPGERSDLIEEDLDDSVFFRRRESRRTSPRHAHKDHQLCAQVAALIATALYELDDPVLSGLMVATVAPAPDASRLLVTVLDPASHPADLVVAHLFGIRGHLRAEIALGITRKRVPELAFVVSAGEDEP